MAIPLFPTTTGFRSYAGQVPTTPLVWQEDNAGITYGGSWMDGTLAPFNGTGYRKAAATSAYAQFVVPAGNTALSMQGHKDSGGSYFGINQNGTRVYNDDQYAASPSLGEYLRNLPNARLPVIGGDLMRFAMTDANYTENGGAAININCFVDQITFHP